MSKQKNIIYEFYAELDDFKPKIWRRFQVNHDITMARLGYILQVLFEMHANHLMMFEVPEGENVWRYVRDDPEIAKMEPALIGRYVNRDSVRRFEMNEYYDESGIPDDNISTEDMTLAKLQHAVCQISDMMRFQYDFADNWQVSLELKNIIKTDGVHRDEMPRVLDGAGFGIVEDCGGVSCLARQKVPEFDIDDMNFRVKNIPRIYRKSYERRTPPTQKSIDLIERKYPQKS